MGIKFEKVIELLFQSEELSPNDKLSKEINKIHEEELIQEELELIAAAGVAPYEKFKERYLTK